MAIFESIAPALVGGALGLIGGQQRNDAAAAQAQSAQNFSAQQFATRYQTTVKDMEAAGLSPMLAYGQGGGSPPTGLAAPVENVGTAAAQGAASGYATGIQAATRENILADTRLKDAQAEAQATQARAAVFSALSSQQLQEKQGQEVTNRIENDTYGSQASASRASAAQSASMSNFIDNQATELGLKLEAGGPEAAVNLLKAQFDETKARTGSLQAARDQALATVKKLDADTSGSVFDNSKKAAFADFYQSEIGKNSPLASFLMDMGKDVAGIVVPWKGRSSRSTGTRYDRDGTPVGGYSTESSTR